MVGTSNLVIDDRERLQFRDTDVEVFLLYYRHEIDSY